MSLETFIRKVHPLVRCMVRSLDAHPHPADELQDVFRYLRAGPDERALAVLASPPTLKSYLYVLHEVIELGPLREHLDAPRPRAGFTRSDGAHVSTPAVDLWAYNFHKNVTLKDVFLHPADHEARSIESQAEKALVRLLFGETITLAAIVWTIETQPGAASGWEDATVRAKVAALLGGLGEPSATEADRARDYRQRLWALDANQIGARLGGVREVAFQLSQARAAPPNDDQRDWFGAEEFHALP